MVLFSHMSVPKQHLHQFSRFSTAHPCGRHTDRQTAFQIHVFSCILKPEATYIVPHRGLYPHFSIQDGFFQHFHCRFLVKMQQNSQTLENISWKLLYDLRLIQCGPRHTSLTSKQSAPLTTACGVDVLTQSLRYQQGRLLFLSPATTSNGPQRESTPNVQWQ